MRKDPFEVVVGNIGTVYAGSSYMSACAKFSSYVKQSESGIGRAGHEDVTLFHNGEIRREHVGKLRENDND